MKYIGTKKETLYRVEYYQPDGHMGGSAPSAYAWILGDTYASVEAAQRAVVAECPDASVWGKDDDGHTCMNESREDGCGGFTIVPLA